MGVRSFLLDDTVNLLVALAGVALFASGVLALTQQQGVASVGLILGGVVAMMILEYRHVHGES